MKLLLASALAALFALPVHAQSCAPRDLVIHRLADAFGESVQTIGLGSDGGIVETFASPETGTWTITVTTPNGTTCLVASGQSFELLKPQPIGSPL